MNIQIFGTKKCNDTKKAERFFKERGVKVQFIGMKEKGTSKGEFTSVASANGGIENMLGPECRDKDTLANAGKIITAGRRPELMSDLQELTNELMQDEEFRREYEALQPEMDITRALLDARIQAGLTQSQLSERTGISQADISRLEKGTRNPSLSILKRLA